MPSDRNIEIVFGGPGTGKTTDLVRIVREALKAGLEPDKFAYMAFSRKAANEALTRILDDEYVKELNYTREDFTWVRTIHSTCYKLMGISKKEIMDKKDYVKFSEQTGHILKGNYSADTERCPIDIHTLGDRSYVVYARAKAMCKSLDDVWHHLNYQDLPFEYVTKFSEELDEYKRKVGKIDFTDLLDICDKTLKIKMAIIDEAQDLTKQQWRRTSKITSNASRVVIAGDDDQAIYTWSGATARPLLHMKADIRRVLPISHRLTKNVKSLADSIIHRISEREPKNFSSRPEMGGIHWLSEPNHVDLSSGKWFLIARNRHMLNELEQIARDQNVVYKHNGRWSNESDSVQAVLDYTRLRRGDLLSQTEARRVAEYSGGIITYHAPKQQWDDFKFPFKSDSNSRPDWMAALLIEDREREYIRGLLRRGESLLKEGRVRIDTVHGSKGGEEDNVLLMTDVSRKIYNAMMTAPDDENRCLYVAITRTIKNLYLVKPQSFTYWNV